MTTPTDALVERLRDTGNRSGYCQTMLSAAALIEQQAAEIARLLALLAGDFTMEPTPELRDMLAAQPKEGMVDGPEG